MLQYQSMISLFLFREGGGKVGRVWVLLVLMYFVSLIFVVAQVSRESLGPCLL